MRIYVMAEAFYREMRALRKVYGRKRKETGLFRRTLRICL